MNDAELIRRFADENSEAAFAELVQRHIGVVYSTALRRVGGDAHLAQDVAQTVFTDLARKASSLRDRPSLAGWAYWSAHAASAAVVRSERRRKNREIEAMNSTLSPDEQPADCDAIRPVLDEAMGHLTEVDREAVVLRFFQQRSFAEIGAALRVSDDGARKRVDRALEKLRLALQRHGIASTATALGATLTSAASTAVPPSIAANVASQALQAAASAAPVSVLGTWAAAVAPTAAVVALGAWLITGQRAAGEALRGEIAQLQQENRAAAQVADASRNLRREADEVAALRQSAAEVSELRRQLDALPAPSVARTSAAITLTAESSIRWNGEAVTLGDYIARLRQLSASAGTESAVVIHAPGGRFDAVHYLVDESRKNQIRHVVVESDAAPQTKLGVLWFQP